MGGDGPGVWPLEPLGLLKKLRNFRETLMLSLGSWI